jgi:protein MpaA
MSIVLVSYKLTGANLQNMTMTKFAAVSPLPGTPKPELKPEANGRGRPRRSLQDLVLSPLQALAENSASLIVNSGACFERDGREYELPRYLFVGPKAGDTPVRVGIFAAIHGDEPEGAHAIVRFLKLLEAKPELAEGYCLSIYPVCNPYGFEDDTRHAPGGVDLNREFWRNSGEPEVQLLEAELSSRNFQGIISLHTDETAEGFYGYARGATLTQQLLEPALQAAESLLPRDTRPFIDGFQARDGIIHDCYPGVLSAPPKSRPRPFELILETPKAAPFYLKEWALALTLKTILVQYRQFIAYAQNL